MSRMMIKNEAKQNALSAQGTDRTIPADQQGGVWQRILNARNEATKIRFKTTAARLLRTGTAQGRLPGGIIKFTLG